MDTIDNNQAPKRRIEDHTPDATLDWTKPGAPAVLAAPAAAGRIPLRAVASMCVKEDGISVFPTPAAKDLAPGHYMLSASTVERAQNLGTALGAPAAQSVQVIDAPRVEVPEGWRHTLETALWADARRDALSDDAKDAARYRWLRDKSEPGICSFYLSVGQAFKNVKFARETVDEAIDAAIEVHTKAQEQELPQE